MANERSGYLEYAATLKEMLTPHYTPPNTSAGYDVNHVKEMEVLGKRIAAIPRYSDLDLDQYTVAVWLHNADRPFSLKERVGERRQRYGSFCVEHLKESPFDALEQEGIVDAILQHSKKEDEEADSTLLSALRIADKVVRFGPLGMIGQPANRGRYLMFYDPDHPFGYDSTAENKLNSVYNDFFRVLEWYGMLPCDEARALISPRILRAQIDFLRVLGEQIAQWTGTDNVVELDIAKALGAYYHDVCV